jgi:hypothetical protein
MSEGLKNVVCLNASTNSKAILYLNKFKSNKVLSQVTGLVSKIGGALFMARENSNKGKSSILINVLTVVDYSLGTFIYVSSTDYLRLLDQMKTLLPPHIVTKPLEKINREYRFKNKIPKIAVYVKLKDSIS